MINEIIRTEQDIEYAKQKLNNDKSYIKLLHEYNYLKDVAFELVGIVANISRVPSKDIFEEFDVRDVEKEAMQATGNGQNKQQ